MIMKHEQQQIVTRSFLLPLSISEFPEKENFVCLFTQNQIVEFIEPQAIQQIPCCPGYLRGVVMYHNTLLPVIDIDVLCNQYQSVPKEHYRQFMVVRTGSVDLETGARLKAIVAARDRMRIAKVSGRELEETFKQEEIPPFLSKSGLLRACFRHGDNSIIVLDLGPVVRGTYTGTPEEAYGQ